MKKQREPINRFKDVPEMNACMKEWQTLLGLSEWLILPVLGNQLEDGNDAECERKPIHKTAIITIRRPIDPRWEDTVLESPDELFLVHELLHCKILYDESNETPHEQIFNLYYHQIIQDLAKALVAAKYGLPLSWFDRLKDDPSIYSSNKEETK